MEVKKQKIKPLPIKQSIQPMNTQTMKAADLFEIDKVQIFDRLTGNYICTMRLTDSTGDTRQISEYTPEIETKEQETDKNQLQLF